MATLVKGTGKDKHTVETENAAEIVDLEARGYARQEQGKAVEKKS
ncbi:hypothetical protein LWF01_02980 [Saxibacter everestensis]|uniref:Uncharacterized protein n=1 Tax=Saxibacter everestensis TaxID=2909229 RepID=A0ABY8QV05_9MICO|nr:hypothetical protein LWF01_02980 [Brevibacteriaceae bacterium ZFBP1038]